MFPPENTTNQTLLYIFLSNTTNYSDIAGIATGLLGSGMAASPAQVLQKMKQRSVLIDIDKSANVEFATTIGGCKGATISPAPTPAPGKQNFIVGIGHSTPSILG